MTTKRDQFVHGVEIDIWLHVTAQVPASRRRRPENFHSKGRKCTERTE